jgi:hypothetical protein
MHRDRNGRLSCAEVPARTYARALQPLLDVDVDAAVSVHLKGMRALKDLEDKAVEIADDHVAFLAVTGNLVRGLNLFKRLWPFALAHTAPETRMAFHAAGACLFTRMSEQKKTVRLALPEALQAVVVVVAAGSSSGVDVAALASWLGADALSIAARFDTRNGNDHCSREVRATVARAARPHDRPLAKKAVVDDE